jgi:periplasmic divalent cation tolerance protein
MAEVLQVTTTVSTREEAERIGRVLVEERLAACAQIAGPVTSMYWWKGQVEQSSEWYCHLKTMEDRYPALEARLRTLHSYEVPEILAVPVDRGNRDYVQWVANAVRHAESEMS